MRQLLRDSRGNVAFTFALAAIPVLLMIGGAVDLSRTMSAKSKLRDTLDGAALAIAAVPNFTQAQADKIANDFAAANYPSGTYGASAKIDAVTFTSTQVNISGSAPVATTMLGLIAINNMNVTADVTVERAGKNVEAALVLDLSGSMGGSRITALKAAATQFVDTVVQNTQTPYTSRVAIAPYSGSVNVGTYATQVRGAVTSGGCVSYGCNSYRFTPSAFGSCQGNMDVSLTRCRLPVSTCVADRTGAHAYTDAAPSTARFGKYYAPASPNVDRCQVAPITPLTSNKTALKTSINNYTTGGATGGHLGAAWGWYLVSPNFSYLFPAANRAAAYTDRQTAKAVVIMTDGEFNAPTCWGVPSADSTLNPVDRINCNSPNGSAITQAATICQNMKAAGVTVYTVGFTIPPGPFEDMLKNCASAPAAPYFSTPQSGADLTSTFQTIANSISQLRVIH